MSRDRNSSRVVEVVEPAINATQIKGMGDLHAYFVQRGFQEQPHGDCSGRDSLHQLAGKTSGLVSMRVVRAGTFSFRPMLQTLPERNRLVMPPEEAQPPRCW